MRPSVIFLKLKFVNLCLITKLSCSKLFDFQKCSGSSSSRVIVSYLKCKCGIPIPSAPRTATTHLAAAQCTPTPLRQDPRLTQSKWVGETDYTSNSCNTLSFLMFNSMTHTLLLSFTISFWLCISWRFTKPSYVWRRQR